MPRKTKADFEKDFPNGKRYRTKAGEIRTLKPWELELLEHFPENELTPIEDEKSEEPKAKQEPKAKVELEVEVEVPEVKTPTPKTTTKKK